MNYYGNNYYPRPKPGPMPGPMPGPYGGNGYRMDLNGDGISDVRVRPGIGVDVNGDGIVDYRTGPRITPDVGMGMGMRRGPYYY